VKGSVMAASIEELTVDYEENGRLKVKEIGKEPLTKGVWTTILFKYKEWNFPKEAYGPMKYTIRRYKKVNGNYLPQSKFNISGEKQAKQVVEVLARWIEEGETE
jgi:hypothetical protein